MRRETEVSEQRGAEDSAPAFQPLGTVAKDGTYWSENSARTKKVKLRLKPIDLATVKNSKGTKYQPRERDRVQSRAQILDLAQRWKPEKSIPATSIEHGPIVVTSEGGKDVIRSGHGREAALGVIYGAAGTPAARSAQRSFVARYLRHLGMEDAAQQAEAMEMPALGAEIVDFGDYASEPDPLLAYVRDANPDEMSRPEEAIKRAGVLRQNPGVLAAIEFDEDGNFLEDGPSGEAILEVIDSMGLRNRLTRDGSATPDLYEDVRRAMLAYVLGADTAEGRQAGRGITLTQLIEDAQDSGLVNFTKGLVRQSGLLAQIRETQPDFIDSAIAPAVSQYVRWKRDGGKGSFQEFIGQQDLFEGEVPEMVERIGRALGSVNGVRALEGLLRSVVEDSQYAGALFTRAVHTLATRRLAGPVDPRIREAFPESEGWEFENGLPVPPRTLQDGAPLLQETLDLNEAEVDAEHPLVAAGLLPEGKVSRNEFREAVIQYFISRGKPVPEGQKPVVLAMGGGGGAGKTTTLKARIKAGKTPFKQQPVEINADEIKELIPEYDRIVQAGDSRAAAVVHEESSWIAKKLELKLVDKNRRERYNIIFDGTMANFEKSASKIKQWQNAGFAVEFLGVTIDPAESITRAVLRAKGKGRWVPYEALFTAHSSFNAGAKNLLALADTGALYDNTEGPKLVAQKDGESVDVKDRATYNLVDERAKQPEKPRELLGTPENRPGRGSGGRAGDRETAVRKPESPRGGSRSRGTGQVQSLGARRLDPNTPDMFDWVETLPPAVKASKPKVRAKIKQELRKAPAAVQEDLFTFATAESNIKSNEEGQNANAKTGRVLPNTIPGGQREGVEKDGERGDSAPPQGTGRPDRSAELKPADRNHRIPAGVQIAPRGNAAKLDANIEAIELLRRLESENRNPGPAEKDILARYTGWGWAGEYFNEKKPAYAKQNARLRELLSEEEYESAAASTLNAHFTDPRVIDGVWSIAERLGFRGGDVLEPAGGVGHFFGRMPESIAEQSALTGVELDNLSGRIFAKLYPQAEVQVTGFERAAIPPASMDLVVSNVPFGDYRVPGAKDYPDLLIHDYFFARGLDMTRPGGLVIFITSDGTMDKSDAKVRRLLAEKADLVGAVRLPNNAFAANAGTEVTTDIIVMRKKDGKPFEGASWISRDKVGEAEVEGQMADIFVNEYYAANPEMALGRHSLEGTMYSAGDYALVAKPGQDTGAELTAVVERFPKDIFKRGDARPVQRSQVAASGDKPGSYVQKDGQFFQVVEGRLEPASWLTQKNYGDKHTEPITDKERRDREVIADDWMMVRDAARELIAGEVDQDISIADLDAMRRRLNAAYDRFIARNGTLTKKYRHLEKAAFLEDDPEYPLLQSLEEEFDRYDQRTKKVKKAWRKADIFSKRVREPVSKPEKAENINDAINILMAFEGSVDADSVANMLGISKREAEDRIVETGRAYLDPATGRLEIAERYLSSNVRKRLRAARAAAETDSRYRANIAALEGVIPPTVPLKDIYFSLASRWIPERVLSAFATDLLGSKTKVSYVAAANTHVVTVSNPLASGNSVDWKSGKLSGAELLTHALKGTSPQITTTVSLGGGKTKTETDFPATQAAKAKMADMERRFESWIKTTAVQVEGVSVQEVVEQEYNDVMNSVVAPVYSGDYLVRDGDQSRHNIPGLSNVVWMNGHRRSAIARILQEGKAVMAHGVGSGKTFSQIVAAMEMKRLGLARKPMIVVQKATIGQFAASVMQAYPAAKVLVATEKTFNAKSRARFISQIATGDYDMVIVTQPQFDRILPSKETIRRFFSDKLAELSEAINRMRLSEGKDSPTTKQLQKAKKRMEGKLRRMMDGLEKRGDDVIDFESTGVDALFIDEAHAYKKASIITNMQRIKGIPNDESQRAMGLEMKTKYIQDRNNGRNVILATGTPITNSVAEAYIMLKLATPSVLEDFGINTFDEFAHTFGRLNTKLERTWSGAWKRVSRFNRFTNGAELVAMIRSGFDVKMGNEELGLKVPKMRNSDGRNLPDLQVVPQTPAVSRINDWIMEIGAEFERVMKSGSSDEKEAARAVPIVTMQVGMAASVDPRLVRQDALDEPGSKVNRAVEEIAKIHQENEYRRGAQVVFLDRFRPINTNTLDAFVGGSLSIEEEADGETDPDKQEKEGPDEDAEFSGGGFNLYRDIRDKLIKRGIPENQIAIIHEHNTDKRREALFEKVNSGEVRVILGSTEKLGVGVNMQERLVAAHHLDPPRSMTPAMLEQRDGRIIRQGNIFTRAKLKDGSANPDYDSDFAVRNIRYGVESTMDVAIYDMMAAKQAFVHQVLKGNVSGREFDDAASEVVMNMRQQVAQLSGDTRVLRLADLEGEIAELDGERRGFLNEVAESRKRLWYLESSIRSDTALAKQYEAISDKMSAQFEGDSVTYDFGENGVFTDRKEAVEALGNIMDQLRKKAVQIANADNTAEISFRINEVPVTLVARGALASFEELRVTFEAEIKTPSGEMWDNGSPKTAEGLLNSVVRSARAGEAKVNSIRARIEKQQEQITPLQQASEQQWPKEEEYAAKQAEFLQLERDLQGPEETAGAEEQAMGARTIDPDQLTLDLSDRTAEVQNLVTDNLRLAGWWANRYRNLGEYDDILQSARLALVKAAEGYNPESGPFAAYANRTISNALNSEYRRQSRRPRMSASLDEPITDDGETLAEVIGEDENVRETAAQGDIRGILRAAVQKLPDRPRAMVENLLSGKTAAETARELEVSPQYVSKILSNALGVLRSRLEGQGIDARAALGARAISPELSQETEDVLWRRIGEIEDLQGDSRRRAFAINDRLGDEASMDARPLPELDWRQYVDDVPDAWPEWANPETTIDDLSGEERERVREAALEEIRASEREWEGKRRSALEDLRALADEVAPISGALGARSIEMEIEAAMEGKSMFGAMAALIENANLSKDQKSRYRSIKRILDSDIQDPDDWPKSTQGHAIWKQVEKALDSKEFAEVGGLSLTEIEENQPDSNLNADQTKAWNEVRAQVMRMYEAFYGDLKSARKNLQALAAEVMTRPEERMEAEDKRLKGEFLRGLRDGGFSEADTLAIGSRSISPQYGAFDAATAAKNKEVFRERFEAMKPTVGIGKLVAGWQSPDGRFVDTGEHHHFFSDGYGLILGNPGALGYVRIAKDYKDGKTVYYQGAPNRTQLKALKDAAIEEGLEIEHDRTPLATRKIEASPKAIQDEILAVAEGDTGSGDDVIELLHPDNYSLKELRKIQRENESDIEMMQEELDEYNALSKEDQELYEPNTDFESIDNIRQQNREIDKVIEMRAKYTPKSIDNAVDDYIEKHWIGTRTITDEDAEYLAAVERGDMETAQRMVDEAARAAGYTIKGYHGTLNGGFKRFNLNLLSDDAEKGVVWFADTREGAERFLQRYRGKPKDFNDTLALYDPVTQTRIERGSTPQVIDAWIRPGKVFDQTNLTEEDIRWLTNRTIMGLPITRETIERYAGSVDGQLLKMLLGQDFASLQDDYQTFKFNLAYGTEQVGHEIGITDPNAVKSADPVTYDDKGNVIPLSQRFNPQSDSILYARTLTPEGDKALERIMAAISEPEVNAMVEKAKGETSGQRTVGNPDRGFSALGPEVMGVDEVYGSKLVREKEADWNEAGRRMAAENPGGVIEMALERGMAGGTLNPEETKAVQVVVAEEMSKPLTPERRRILTGLVWAYRQTGTEAGRQLASRKDPFMSPAERHREFLAKAIFTPPSKVRKQIEKADQAEKQRLLDAESARIKAIEKALNAMGITFDMIFGGEVELILKGSAIVKNILSGFTSQDSKIVRALQGGAKSFEVIGKEMGATAKEVEAVRDRYADAVNTRYRDTVRKLLERGVSPGEVAKYIDQTGVALGAAALGNREVSDADVDAAMAQVLEAMGIAPKTEQGKRKTVRRRVPKRRPLLQVPQTPVSDAPVGPTPGAYPEDQTRLELNEDQAARNRTRMPRSDAPAAPEAGPQQKLPLEYENREIMVRFPIDDAQQVVRVARTAQAASGNPFDMAIEYWINGILSGPQTHIVNIAGNFANTAWDMTVQRGMEAVMNLMVKDQKGAQFGEFKHLLAGLRPGLAKGWKMAVKAWDAESDFFESEVLGGQVELFEDFDKAGGVQPAIKGRTGRIVRIPGRLLLFMDSLFKFTIGRMETGAMAFRIGKQKGLEGKKLEEFIADEVNTPGSMSWQYAVDKAVDMTFQTPLKNADEGGNVMEQLARNAQDLRRKAKILSFIIPFVRTPYNIFATGIRKTPLGSIPMTYRLLQAGFFKFRDGKPVLTSHPQLVRDMAEQTIAWVGTLMLLGMAEGDEDDDNKLILISGSRPSNSALADMQARTSGGPYSIRIGGRNGVTVSYGRLEPFATILGTVVDAARMTKSGGGSQEKTSQFFSYMVGQTQDKTFTAGIGGLMETIQNFSDPDRADFAASRFRSSFLSGLVPNIIRQPLRNMDEFQRDYRTAQVYYDMLPIPQFAAPRIDQVTGEPVRKDGNAASRLLIPWTREMEGSEQVDVMLRNWNRENPSLAWAPPRPSNKISRNGEQIELDADEYQELVALSAKYAGIRLRSVLNSLNTRNPTEDDFERVKKAFEQGRALARREMLLRRR